MAKSTKPKAEKQKKETALTEPVIEETKQEEVITEPNIEVNEEVSDNSDTIIEEKVDTPEPVFEETPMVSEKIEVVNSNVSVLGAELTMEEKIVNFIENRNGEIKLNDFLKSLYGVPKFNEPPVFLRQGVNRQLRAILDNMQKSGLINIEGNRHLRLGNAYYENSDPKTKYHNLNTVPLVVKK